MADSNNSISAYNKSVTFTYEMKESRLLKSARMIEKLPKGKFLDIGCANGDWALHWKSRGHEVFGIDIDSNSVARSTERGVPAKECDLNSSALPFADNYFDCIYAGEVIEHLVDTDRFLQEIERCLKPGGHLLITTPNLVSFENRVRILFGIYPIWVNYNLTGSGHIRAYTPSILKKQLQACGLTVKKHTGNWVPFLPQKIIDDVKMPILAISGCLFPSFAMDIILLAQKGTAHAHLTK
ncbi:MAG: hypothetical protein A2X86_12265 [Bdellovibrionales bacterium GWA2_49_15]|nr:MAG: hypothetical protein A2X86_12265 [Bdellovibrionales bacterium GWA2_49_15]